MSGFPLFLCKKKLLLLILWHLWASGTRVWAGGGQRPALSTGCPHGPEGWRRPEGLVHNRDGNGDEMQVTYGLLCAADGCPVAVEVFAGNAGDPSTVASQVDKVRSRFGIGRVVLVGDRGMLATARIREDLAPAGLNWISALKTGDIRKLLREGRGTAPRPRSCRRRWFPTRWRRSPARTSRVSG